MYIGVSLVVVGRAHYTDIDEGAPIADAFDHALDGYRHSRLGGAPGADPGAGAGVQN